MTTKTLTEIQQQAIECLEGARSAGVALSEHVRGRGLNLRSVYDAIAQLRRRGIVPPAQSRRVRQRAAGTPRFARVRIQERASQTAAMGPLRLRLLLANGRHAELDVDSPNQLTRIIAALESAG